MPLQSNLWLTKRATLIFNPNAGYDDWQHRIEAVAQFWQRQGWEVGVHTTERPGHATRLAQAAAAAGCRLVLVAGGDGTLHEAANGLAGADCVLAPLPAGTTNCLARELGLPQPDYGDPNWLIHASAALLAGRVQQMDVGECSNGKRWLLWAGAGIESRLVERVEPRSPWLKRLGFAGYVAKAALPFLTYVGSAARVVVDDQVIEGELISMTICNTRLFAGGLYNLNPHGVLDDGLFEVWIFPGRFAPQMMLHGLSLMTQGHLRLRDAYCLQGRHVIIEPRSAPGVPSGRRSEPLDSLCLHRAARRAEAAGAGHCARRSVLSGR